MPGEFLSLLQQTRNGGLLQEADETLHDLNEFVKLNRKPVELTLKVRITPHATGDEVHRVDVTADVVGKTPKLEKAETIFFFGAEGQLTRVDPRQREFDFRPQLAPSEADGSQRLPKAVVPPPADAKKKA